MATNSIATRQQLALFYYMAELRHKYSYVESSNFVCDRNFWASYAK
jgi:hypothetical protein